MTFYVEIALADERADQLVDLAMVGEQVVFTKDGIPLVIMSPVAPDDQSQ